MHTRNEVCEHSLSVSFQVGQALVVVREVLLTGQLHLTLCLVTGGGGRETATHW